MQIETIAATDAAPACIDFTADAAAFHAAAAFLAGKVIERRNSLPILSHIRLVADVAGFVTLTGTNLDQLATVTIPATVASPGALCVMADALADALAKGKKARDEARFYQDAEAWPPRASLKCGRSAFHLACLPADDFPLTPTGDTEGEQTLSAKFSLPAAQLLADLATLAPCVEKSGHRYYLQGVAMQRRDLAGQERLVFAACDGSNLAVASRPLPAGAESLPDMILPGAVLSMVKAAAKVAGNVETARLVIDGAFGMGNIVLQLGAVTLYSKAIDGDFPDWQRIFERATPTGEGVAPMFPELLPGAPTAAIERIGKVCPASLAWEACGDLFVGSAPDDAGLAFAAMRCNYTSAGAKGFSFTVQDGEARAYLLALAESRGLPSPDDMAARCDAVGAKWYGAKVARVGNRAVGLTMEAQHWVDARRETVTDWEALTEREIYTPAGYQPVEGSYSVLMPADGPVVLTFAGSGEIIGPDGVAYPVADDGRKIHLSKDHVRALIGESCFETVEFAGADGKPLYVARWLFEQGDSRLLLVRKDGRCPPEGQAREYVTREHVMAALAGEPLPAVFAADLQPIPTVEIEAPGAIDEIQPEWPAGGECATMTDAELRATVEPAGMVAAWDGILATGCNQAGQPLSPAQLQAVGDLRLRMLAIMAETAPVSAQEPVEAVTGPEAAADAPTGPENGQDDPIAAILSRLDALEAALATLPGESVEPVQSGKNYSASIPATPSGEIRPKRTPAHERAIRRAWAERRAARDALRGVAAFREMAEVTEAALIAEREEWEAAQERANHRGWQQRNRRRKATERARRMIAAERAKRLSHQRVIEAEAQRMVDDARANMEIARKDERDARQAMQAAQAELARLKRDMADPTQPERASDIAQLVRERDAARTALAAVTARAERAEASVQRGADVIEGMASRLAVAEAAVRRMAG